MVLSWEDAIDGAATVDDGRNVVIHEFAHQLDQENGRANGAPPMAGRRDGPAGRASSAPSSRPCARTSPRARPTLIGSYGASDPAEFFAVASEVFFEQPAEMAVSHAELYRVLREFYRVDPLSW